MYSRNKLFNLRGNLDNRTDLILQILGVVLILGFWWLLSFMATTTNITQLDEHELANNEITIANEMYVITSYSIHYTKLYDHH